MTDRVCDGCGGSTDPWLIQQHPSGRWYHADFCMPPDEWRPQGSRDDAGNQERKDSK